jgi:hypothetical protein
MPAMIFEKVAGRHTIYADTKDIGNDLLVAIYGGDEHHVGGVAVSYPTPSHYRDATTISLNSISLPGHKDYIVANSTAIALSKALACPVIATVGIHYDKASREEIEEIVRAVELLTEDIISHYQNAE